jgi:hypothetical protein
MAALTLFWVGAAAQAPAVAAATCDGVWVVVDYGSLGGTSTACATSYGTGTAALRSAGFSPTLDSGMVIKIDAKPASPDINKDYWSYWTATRKADGSYSGWSYSSLGANGSHPAKGNAEGWRYLGISDGKVPPAEAPPKGEVATPTPTPTPSPTKTSPKPTRSATPTKSATPTRSAAPTKSATPSATATASASASASASATTTAATPDAAASITPEPSTPTPTTAVSSPQAGPDGAPGQTGSPVGAIAAGATVIAGGAGIGGWWLLKGRKP